MVNSIKFDPLRTDMSLYPPQNSENCHQGHALFQQLTANLSTHELDIINHLNDHDKLESVISAITNDWQNEVFEDPNVLRFALKAVKEEKLSEVDFCTAAIWWSVVKTHGLKNATTVSLFDLQGNPSKEASDIFHKMFAEQKQGTLSHVMNPQQFVQFFALMKSAPQNQHCFRVVEDTAPWQSPENELRKQQINEKGSIIQRINERGVNVFCRIHINGKPMRIIPNWTMMQAYLNVRFATQAVTLYGTIDFAQTSAMEEDALHQRRVVSLPYHDIVYKEADLLKIHADYEMVYHDGTYHGIVTSMIPQDHVNFYIILAKQIKSTIHLDEFKNYKSIILKFYEKLIDLELTEYAKDMPLIDKWMNRLVYFENVVILSICYEKILAGGVQDEVLRQVISEFLEFYESFRQHIGKTLVLNSFINTQEIRDTLIKYKPLKEVYNGSTYVFPYPTLLEYLVDHFRKSNQDHSLPLNVDFLSVAIANKKTEVVKKRLSLFDRNELNIYADKLIDSSYEQTINYINSKNIEQLRVIYKMIIDEGCYSNQALENMIDQGLGDTSYGDDIKFLIINLLIDKGCASDLALKKSTREFANCFESNVQEKWLDVINQLLNKAKIAQTTLDASFEKLSRKNFEHILRYTKISAPSAPIWKMAIKSILENKNLELKTQKIKELSANVLLLVNSGYSRIGYELFSIVGNFGDTLNKMEKELNKELEDIHLLIDEINVNKFEIFNDFVKNKTVEKINKLILATMCIAGKGSVFFKNIHENISSLIEVEGACKEIFRLGHQNHERDDRNHVNFWKSAISENLRK